MSRYQGKSVVITGAAGGIGTATAHMLAGLGAPLLLIDPNAEALARLGASLPDARTAVSDLTSLAACRAALATLDGEVHGLVHLAGIFETHALDDDAVEVYRRTMAANADNAFEMVIALQGRLRRDSRIVLISSLAFTRGSPQFVAYTMAKGALVGLTRALSRRLAPDGVLVNALAPGIIDTPMPAELIARNGDALRAAIPLGRFGTAGEVAGVIEFLLSPASSYITGQLIHVDGGQVNA